MINKSRNINWLFWVLIFVTIIPVFYHWLTLKTICSGDCLYFYPENLKSLFDVPFVWDNRGGNSGLGSPTSMFLYMYLPSLISGLLYNYFQITYNISEKIIWFFPFLIFSITSIFYLTKTLNLSKIVSFFAIIFYVLNTYILLVVDGGQVGIALAYSLFPLVLGLFIKSLSDNFKKKIIFGLSLALLGVFDFRIALLASLSIGLYSLFFLYFEKKTLHFKLTSITISLITALFIVCGIHFYWILPTIISGGIPALSSAWGNVEQAEQLSWMNLNHLFFVFQPNWPQNSFGKLNPIQFEFFLIPVIAFFPLVFKKINYQFLFLISITLIFTFLGKGFQEPLSDLYRFLFNTIPGFGFFRDPSKFFIPQLTAYVILFGISIDKIYHLLKMHPKLAKLFLVTIVIYQLILVRSAIYPGLNHTFRAVDIPEGYTQVKDNLEKDLSYYRTLWYPAKNEFSYQNSNHPAISATYDLRNIRPLNIFVAGTYDLFSYLQNSFSQQIFEILGIRSIYIVDPIKTGYLSKTDMEDRLLLGKNLNEASWLEKQTQNKLPSFENPSYAPHVFIQDKTFWISGSDDLYRTLADYPNFRLKNVGFVVLDENQTQEKINQMTANKDILFYNNKSNIDLALSLVDRRKFYNGTDFVDNKNGTGGWGKSSSSDLINWRNILENRGFNNLDFDLEKGFIWTDSPAKINFPINIIQSGNYEIYLRFFANHKGSDLTISLNQSSYEINTKSDDDSFVWQKIGESTLSSDNNFLSFESKKGFNVINAVAIIPKGEIIDKLKTVSILEAKTDVIYAINAINKRKIDRQNIKTGDYKILIKKNIATASATLKINDHELSITNPNLWNEIGNATLLNDNSFEASNIQEIILYPVKYSKFSDFFQNTAVEIDLQYINPTKYKVKIKNSVPSFMLIFSENFNKLWELKTDNQVFHPVSVYSTINGFNVGDSNGNLEGEINFNLQQYIYPGIVISILSLAAAAVLLII